MERDGANPSEVKANMDKSWARFQESLTIDKNEAKLPHITEFVYNNLTESGKKFAEFGVTILKQSAPLVLLFNKKIESIELDYYGEKATWKTSQPIMKEADFELNEIQITTNSSGKPSVWIASLKRNKVTVAFELIKQEDNYYAVVDNNLPKLFADFPLTESHDFPSTLFINSSFFETTNERTGIYFPADSESTGLINENLLKDAFVASTDIFKESIKRNWKNLHVLCPRGIVSEKRWINKNSQSWLQKQLLNVIDNLMPLEIVTSKSAKISIADSIIPNAKKENVELMWDILSRLIEFKDILPSRDSVVHWATLIEEWRQLPDGRDIAVKTINIQELAERISSLDSIQEIGSKLISPESNNLLFCNDELIDIPNLSAKLQNPQDSLSKFLRDQFSEDTQQILNKYLKSNHVYSEVSEAVRSALVNELNTQLKNETLYNEERFSHVTLTNEILKLIEQNPQDETLTHLNRKLIEQVYSQEIAKSEITAALIWLNSFIELCIQSNNIIFNKYGILPNENRKLKLQNDLRIVESLDDILKDIGINLGEDFREIILHPSIDNKGNRLEIPILKDFNKFVLQPILYQLHKHAVLKYKEPTYRRANVDLLWVLVNKGYFNDIEANYPILSLAEPLESSKPSSSEPRKIRIIRRSSKPSEPPESSKSISSLSNERMLLSPVSQWDEKAREYYDVMPSEFVLSNDYDKRFTVENYKCLEEKQLLTSKLVFLEKKTLGLDQLNLLSEGQIEDNTENKVEHRSQEIEVSNLLYLSEINKNISRNKTKARRFLKFILEYVLDEDDKWDIIQKVECQCKSESGHKIYPSEWFRYLKANKWIPVENGKSTPTPSAIAELLGEEENLISLLQKEKPHKFLNRLGVSLSDTAKFMVSDDETTRLKMDEAMGSLGLNTRGNPEQLQEIAELVSTDPKFFEIIGDRKKNLEKVRANQKVGNAIEGIIREMLTNEFQGILKVSKVRVARDVVIEEDYIEDDKEVILKIEPAKTNEPDPANSDGEEVNVKIEAQKFEYSVEIKSTKANSVRMTLPQAKLSSEQGERFFLCVYPNKGEETTNEIIKTNSKFISNIGKLLKPKFEQINDYNSIREDVAEKDEGIEIDLGENKIHLRINEKLWQDAISFDKFVDLVKQNLLKSQTLRRHTQSQQSCGV